jgi:hypothetical protein
MALQKNSRTWLNRILADGDSAEAVAAQSRENLYESLLLDESLLLAETDDLGERRRLERKPKHLWGTEHPTRIVLRRNEALERY